jgi:hypothetical protein
MKTFTLITGLTLLSSTLFAQNQMYAGVGVGMDFVEDADDNGILGELSIGTVFDNNFGIEGKFSTSISDSQESYSGIKEKDSITTVSVFLTYNHPVNYQLTFTPKIGFSKTTVDVKQTDNFGGVATGDDSDTGISFGFDVKYKYNLSTNIYAGYTLFDPKLFNQKKDLRMLSVGIQKKF